MTEPVYVIHNFFEQAQRAGELMAEQDAKMAKVIEDLKITHPLVSISYDH